MNQSREHAEIIAIQALEFIGSARTRLNRFMEMTGLDPATIRETAKLPGFYLAILDWVATDEWLLKEFAAQAFSTAEAVESARLALQPQVKHCAPTARLPLPSRRLYG